MFTVDLSRLEIPMTDISRFFWIEINIGIQPIFSIHVVNCASPNTSIVKNCACTIKRIWGGYDE